MFMQKKNTNIKFMAICLMAFNCAVLAEMETIILEDKFINGHPKDTLFKMQGQTESIESVFTIKSDIGQRFCGIQSTQQFELPYLKKGDKYALRVEWRAKAIQQGGVEFPFDIRDYKWGCEMRAMGGECRDKQGYIQLQVPFVVGVNNDKVYLNATDVFDLKPTKDNWHSYAIEFTADCVISFKIDGKEMLPHAIDSLKTGDAQHVTIRFGDFKETNSQSAIDFLKVSKIDYNDDNDIDLKWRHKAFKYITPSNETGALITTVSPMKKILKNTKLFNEPLNINRYSMAAAGRESESFQIVVFATKADIKGVNLSFSDLLNSDGNGKIDAKNIKYTLVNYVQTQAVYVNGPHIGELWPDPLMNQASVDINSGDIETFWVTVSVPPDQPAGNYRGIVTLKDTAFRTIEQVLIELRVYGFNLPISSYLKTAFCFRPQTWVAWYKSADVINRIPNNRNRGETLHRVNINGDMLRWIPQEKWELVYDLLLSHRVNPMNYYILLNGEQTDMWPFPEDWQKLVDRGLNAISLLQVNTDYDTSLSLRAVCSYEKYRGNKDLYKKEMLEHISEYYNKAKELKGFNGDLFVYGFDESNMTKIADKTNLEIQDLYGTIHEKFPNVKRASANNITEKHHGLFDIWVPVTWHFDYALASERKKAGDDIWCYVCCGPGKPMSNFFIDYPGADHRVLFWELRRANISGLLYWNITHYSGQKNWNTPEPKWPDIQWNPNNFGTMGDGYLIYPGKDMIPLSSIRLENIRDGIEDYDYITMARQLSAELSDKNDAELQQEINMAINVPAEISSNFSEHTYNPALIEKQKRLVGETIEKLFILKNEKNK